MQQPAVCICTHAKSMDLHGVLVRCCARHSCSLLQRHRCWVSTPPSRPKHCILVITALSVQVKALGAEVGVRFLTLGFEPSLTSQEVPLIPDMRAALFGAIPEWVAADETEVAREHVFSTASIQASLVLDIPQTVLSLCLRRGDVSLLLHALGVWVAGYSLLTCIASARHMLAGEPGLQQRSRHGGQHAARRRAAAGRGRPVRQLAFPPWQAQRRPQLAGTQLDARAGPQVGAYLGAHRQMNGERIPTVRWQTCCKYALASCIHGQVCHSAPVS